MDLLLLVACFLEIGDKGRALLSCSDRHKQPSYFGAGSLNSLNSLRLGGRLFHCLLCPVSCKHLPFETGPTPTPTCCSKSLISSFTICISTFSSPSRSILAGRTWSDTSHQATSEPRAGLLFHGFHCCLTLFLFSV